MPWRRHRPWLLALALAASPWLPAGAATWIAGPQGEPLTLVDAVRQAADGDTVELLPGSYAGEPLVVTGRRLRFKGVADAAGKRPVVDGAGGRVAGARALWTVRGGDVTVEAIEFRGARGDDGEAAGLRLEGGQLTVRRALFHDNERGLQAGDDAAARLTVHDSEFGQAPRVPGRLPHLLDVGRIARLEVVGSRFQQGFEGQLIKTRARENRIAYNFIHDGPRGGASYEIEIAAGGLASVIGNVVGQGSATQNPVMLVYGTDARVWERHELVVAHNTFVNHGWLPAWFVRVVDRHLPAGVEVVAVNNLLVGPGLLWPALRGRVVEGNRHLPLAWLRDPDTSAFELPRWSRLRGSAVEPGAVAGRDLTPAAEFEWPVGTVPIAPATGRWAPGAFQR